MSVFCLLLSVCLSVTFVRTGCTFQLQISLTVIDSPKFKGYLNSASLPPINISLFPTILIRFPTFQCRVENKVLWISEVTQHFEKCFTDYDRGTRALQKVCGEIGLPHNLVVLFQVENWLLGKSENIEYLWHYATDCLHFFTMCLGNNGLLNKIYWHDLDIIHEDHSKGNISQFCFYLGYPWTNFNEISTAMMDHGQQQQESPA